MEELVTVLQSYIHVVAFIVCLCVGYIVKNVVTNQAINRFIPVIVGVLGVVIVAWSEMAFTPDVLALGLVSGLASTGAYEVIDQLRLRSYEKKVDGMAADPSELYDAEKDGE